MNDAAPTHTRQAAAIGVAASRARSAIAVAVRRLRLKRGVDEYLDDANLGEGHWGNWGSPQRGFVPLRAWHF